MPLTPMQRKYQRFPRLMFHWRRLRGVNYEPEMELLDILCDPRKTSVDVGAKIGMYTYRLLRHSSDVVSFEPIPLLSEMLRKVFAGRRCRIVNSALSDAGGRLKMRIPYGSNGEVKFGRSTIEANNPLTHGDVASVEEVEVNVTTLDACRLDNVGFVKIDVEGHELAVLRGAAETLERERPTLLVEANDDHHPRAVQELRDLMAARSYRGYYLHRGRLLELPDVIDSDAFRRDKIENFLFVHASRLEVARRVEERLAR